MRVEVVIIVDIPEPSSPRDVATQIEKAIDTNTEFEVVDVPRVTLA